MSESLNTIQWSNKTNEIVGRRDKAEYMAHVENQWRESIAKLIKYANENPERREDALKAAEYQAVVFGPTAVEAAGKAWEEFTYPVLPPEFFASISDPSYATGDRMRLPDQS